MCNRRQRVVLGESISDWVSVTSGVPQGSVLGPLLFIIFINDLSDSLKNICEIFADDSKVLSIIKNMLNCLALQDDLQKIDEWTKIWLVKLNDEKCKVMHCGINNPKFDYSINGTVLNETTCERDLGVQISNDLKWSNQVNYAANKANQVLGSIKKTIKFQNKESLSRLYKAFVRPHLEYAVQVWNPYLKKDVKVLESVQRRATKLVPGLKKLSYTDRLKELNLTTLEERRVRGDLIEMYKITTVLDKINWHKPLKFKKSQDSMFRQIPRSHDFTIERFYDKTSFRNFYSLYFLKL